jgi:transcription termination factor Rho
MQKVADYVNEKKRIAENLNAVLAICNCITGLTTSYNLAQPHRKYVRQGTVLSLSLSRVHTLPLITFFCGCPPGRLIEVEGHQGEARTRGEERYCFLFNDLLLVTKEKSGYFKKHKDVKALTMSDLKDPKSELTFKCLYGLHIAEAQLVDLPDSENNKFNNMFQITKTNLSVLSSSFGLVKSFVSFSFFFLLRSYVSISLTCNFSLQQPQVINTQRHRQPPHPQQRLIPIRKRPL